jgi:type II secretion system protein G
VAIGPPSAEESFRKIEEHFHKAGAVCLTFETFVDRCFRGSGTLLLKQGDKANLTYTFGGKNRLCFVSDGTKMKYIFEPDDGPPKTMDDDTPRPLWREIGVIRFGPFEGVQYAGFLDRYAKGSELDRFVKKSLHLSNFAATEDQEGQKILTYRIMFDEECRGDVRLWYDPKSCKPLRREIRHRFWPPEGSAERVTETHEDFTLDADIPEEKLKLAIIQEFIRDGARIDLARLGLREIGTALSVYAKDIGEYPTTEQGLDVLLVEPKKGAGSKNWKGPYLSGKQAVTDPWGQPYVYTCPLEKNPFGYYLFSTGPDGKAGTRDDIYPQ